MRIALWVLLSVTILYVAALFIMFHYSHNAIEKESLEKAQQMLNGKTQLIDNHLHEVEVATSNMLWNVEAHLNQPDSMYIYCMQLVQNNPQVVGCAVAFEPNYYPEKGEFFWTYVYRDTEDPEELLLTHDPRMIQPEEYCELPYVALNWYSIPKGVNQTCWVRPHAPEDTINSTIITCGTPIHDKQGKTVGVLAADVLVDWFSSAIFNPKPFRNSYCMMLGVQGSYIVHPDSTYLYHKMVREVVKNEPDPRVGELVESMLSGESGCQAVQLGGQDCYVLYKALNNGHWCACMVCPESDIFEVNKRQQYYMIIISILGILLIVGFCFYFIKHQLKPLNMLADSAQRISQGDYATSIPPTSRRDEIGILQNNFGAMQTSLSRQIQEMNQLSETLKERNEALGAIHEQVQETDNMKMNLIHRIADKMIMPIRGIAGVVTRLEEHCEEISQEDIDTMSDELMGHTKSVTDLLDQMYGIPKQKSTTKKS